MASQIMKKTGASRYATCAEVQRRNSGAMCSREFRHVQCCRELTYPMFDAAAIKLRMVFDDPGDVKQVLGAIGDGFEDDQGFNGGEAQLNITDPLDSAAGNGLFLKGQHAQGDIHANAACLMSQQGHPVATRELICIGDAGRQAQLSGRVE